MQGVPGNRHSYCVLYFLLPLWILLLLCYLYVHLIAVRQIISALDRDGYGDLSAELLKVLNFVGKLPPRGDREGTKVFFSAWKKYRKIRLHENNFGSKNWQLLYRITITGIRFIGILLFIPLLVAFLYLFYLVLIN